MNISFKFYVPVMKEGKAPANIKGITLDAEDNTGDLVPLEKLMTLETVVLITRKEKQESPRNGLKWAFVVVDMFRGQTRRYTECCFNMYFFEVRK